MDLNWDKLLADTVAFTQRLIQIPSMSYQEAAIAAVVVDEMKNLGFAEVGIDDAGNVSGMINGRDRSQDAVVLNCHLDHVDPGDQSLWPVPPYSGSIVDGRIFGRGACDVKGAIAVQIYAMAALLRSGIIPFRDVIFSGVVQEEVGGAGARYWAQHLDYPVELIILGEPSSNQLSLGHRGIYQMWVKFAGKAAHASLDNESNPNFALSKFLVELDGKRADFSSHPVLGKTTVTPTIIEVDTESMNVSPAWSRVLLDFRTASESPASLLKLVREIAAGKALDLIPALDGADEVELSDSKEALFGYYTPPQSPIVKNVSSLIAEGTGREPLLTNYRFATDGRFFEPHGLTVLGYSPGEELLAHTSNESISIDMMAEALRGYAHLISKM